MILIADSSALIALAIVDKLDLLDQLFGNVYIPRAVYNEMVQQNKLFATQLQNYSQDKVLDISSSFNFNVSLGLGESEAIILYQEKNADYLLWDDKKAKKFAQSFGINVIGSLGILLKAKEKRYIEKISPLVEILRNSPIFIDEKTLNIVLKMADEL